MASNSNSVSSNSSGGSNDTALLYLLFALMFLAGGYFVTKMLAGSSYILFYWLVAPTYVYGNIIPLGLGVFCLALWALFYFYFKQKDLQKPRKFYLLSFGFVLILGGIFGGFASPVAICDPQQLEPTWDFYNHCKIERITLLSASTLWLLSNVFMYNLLIVSIPLTSSIYNIMTAGKRSGADPMKALSKNLDFDELVKIQTLNFPWLAYYRKLDLASKSMTEGQFRRMDTTRRFAFSNDLVVDMRMKPVEHDGKSDLNEKDTKAQDFVEIDSRNYMPDVDRDLFYEICYHQLGDLFTGFENMSTLELFVACIAIPRACCVSEKVSSSEVVAEEKQIYMLLDSMWPKITDAIDENGTILKNVFNEEFKTLCLQRLQKWQDSDVVSQLIESHAYNRTLIYAAIIEARRLGVLISVDFGWFKNYDRILWAMVQNVGRDAFYSECVAVDNHYFAEKLSGRKIYTPEISECYEDFCQQLRTFNFDENFKEDWENYYYHNDPTGLEKRKVI